MPRQVVDSWSFAHMVDLLASSAVTAIHNSEFESFAASTLFGQGWSVQFRALDALSLMTFVEQSKEMPEVVLISTDLSGISEEIIEKLRSKGIKVFLFCTSQEELSQYPGAHIQSRNPLDLINLIRGSLRSPMLRTEKIKNLKPKARVISVVGAHHSVGCTSLSINLASELSLLNKSVLIVDAHAYFPAIALRLAQRGITKADTFHRISVNLSALEITEEKIAACMLLLEKALAEFDFIIIDNGVVQDLPETLSGRRWSGEIFVWASMHADEMLVLSKSDYLSLASLQRLSEELSKNSIKPTLSFVHSHVIPGKKASAQEERFLEIVMPLIPKRVLRFPMDSRSITSAENERLPLHESNEKSLLRKSVIDIAGELSR